MSFRRLERLILDDPSAVKSLQTVRSCGPRNAYIAAGFVRNRYWDSLYDPMPSASPSDVDVVYFDQTYNLKTRDLAYEASLKIAAPGIDWQVRNQARMHAFHRVDPFTSLEDALQHWAETATGIGVCIDDQEKLAWISAFGFDDLFDHVLRITPAMKALSPDGFENRLAMKRWLTRWPNLTVVRD